MVDNDGDMIMLMHASTADYGVFGPVLRRREVMEHINHICLSLGSPVGVFEAPGPSYARPWAQSGFILHQKIEIGLDGFRWPVAAVEVAERSKALDLGSSPKGRGFKSHPRHFGGSGERAARTLQLSTLHNDTRITIAMTL